MEKTSNKRKPYNTMLTVEKSHEAKYPDNVRWGRGTDTDNTATLTFEDLKNIYNLDLDYSFTTAKGKINYQKKGVPIGGFLSGFYANTVCAYFEHKYLTSLKHTAHKIFGIRQMDDLLVWIATDKNIASTRKHAQAIKRKILKLNGVYLGGLELEEEKVNTTWINKEKHFIHEFAGLEITLRAKNPTMICRTLNKNKHSMAKMNEQTIVRFPPWESYTTEQSKTGVIIGTLYRTEQQNTTTDLAAQSMYDNYKEYRSIGYKKKFYIGTLNRLMRKEGTPDELKTIAQKTIKLIHTKRHSGRARK
jgi:hypothetical protein